MTMEIYWMVHVMCIRNDTKFDICSDISTVACFYKITWGGIGVSGVYGTLCILELHIILYSNHVSYSLIDVKNDSLKMYIKWFNTCIVFLYNHIWWWFCC